MMLRTVADGGSGVPRDLLRRIILRGEDHTKASLHNIMHQHLSACIDHDVTNQNHAGSDK